MTHCIALVGASGAGKTTIGRLLADRFGVPFIDVDQQIEADTGLPIAEIFARHGEPHFRALERDTTIAALGSPGILSLGGGAPMTPEVADALRAHRHVIWLQVDAAEAARRIGVDPHRPLLSSGDVRAKIEQMLAVRTPVYRSVASLVVDTNQHTRAEVVDAVAAHVAVIPGDGVDLR